MSASAKTPSQGRVLVTGGAGFIGSALVWRLNRRGNHDILISDRLGSDEKWRNLTPLRFRDYIDGLELLDKLDRHPLAFGPIDLVLHLGACSATTEPDCDYLMRNNTDYTRRLAAWALHHGARFVYASSAATYGDGGNGMDDSSEGLERLRPLNMYGYSKHLFDQMAGDRGWLDRIVGLKYFNVFGPNEDHKGDMRSVVHKAFQQIRSGGEVTLFRSHRPDYRDGEQQRDFLYVKDAVDMTLHLADHADAAGLFNLGAGVARTWLDLARAIFAALELEPNIRFIDMPETLREKYQYHTCARLDRLQGTGYDAPITSLEDAVTDYVRNYLTNDRRLGDE